MPRASPAEVVLSILVFGGFALCLWKIWSIQRASDNQVDKARLGTLLALMSGAVLFSGLESLARNLGPVTDTATLGLLARSMVMQGAFPPIGAFLGSLCCYLLYQTVEHTRLLDLYEIVARIFSLTAAALVLVVMDGVSVIWVSSFSDYPVHATFQIFLASLLFLGLYDPLRDRIETVAGGVVQPSRSPPRADTQGDRSLDDQGDLAHQPGCTVHRPTTELGASPRSACTSGAKTRVCTS